MDGVTVSRGTVPDELLRAGHGYGYGYGHGYGDGEGGNHGSMVL